MKAFTLMEITISMIVLGVLASLAITNFSTSMERMRTRGAITVLQTTRYSWKDFELRNGAPTNGLANLDMTVPALSDWSGVTLNSPTTATLIANCTGNPCLNAASWVANITRSGSMSYPLRIQIDGTITCGTTSSTYTTICNNLNIPEPI